MGSRHRWPSRWWWWVPFIGANVYLPGLLLFPGDWDFWHDVPPLVRAPLVLFGEFVARPVIRALGPETLGPLTGFAIFLALWELVAVVLGLVCYGAVLLLYAIVPDGPDSGERERGQTGR